MNRRMIHNGRLCVFGEYLVDDAKQVCGAKYLADLGHGYGFDNGKKEISVLLFEEFSFDHWYTDTSEGTWNTDCYRIVVRLVEK